MDVERIKRGTYLTEKYFDEQWADAPDGKIKKSDVTIAKNYLSEEEMNQLNRMVSAEIAKLHAETEFEK